MRDGGGFLITAGPITGTRCETIEWEPDYLINQAQRQGGSLDPQEEQNSEIYEYQVQGKWYPAEQIQPLE